MSEAMKCPACGGFNLSLDINTGIMTCHDCPGLQEPMTSKHNLFDSEDWKEEQMKKEQEAINKMINQGSDVRIRDGDKDFNDFSKVGL